MDDTLKRHRHNGSDSDRIRYSDLAGKPSPIEYRQSIRAMFETAGRYVGASSGTSAARTFDTEGLTLTSGLSSNSYAYNEIKGALATMSIFDVPLAFDATCAWSAEANGTHRTFLVFGSVGGTTTTYTEKHFGFEFIANATVKVRGTVGNGTARTTIDLDVTGITLSDDTIYSAVFNPATGVIFLINGQRVGVISDLTILPKGAPTDSAVWSEQKTIRDNAGTSVNTVKIRWLNLHIPLEGVLRTKL